MRRTIVHAVLSIACLAGCSFEEAHLHERAAPDVAPGPTGPSDPMGMADVIGDDPAAGLRDVAPDSMALPSTGTGSTDDGDLGGAIRFATSTAGPSGGVFRTAVQRADLPLLWVRVTVNDMPTMALRKLALIDPTGRVFLETEDWYSTDAGVSLLPGAPGGEASVSTAIADGAAFSLDRHLPLGTGSQPPIATGVWEVLAWLDGYPGTLRAKLAIRP